MTRRTQTILFHTLPIAFWLLAAVVCVLTYLLSPSLEGMKSSARSDALWSSVEQTGVGFFAPAVLSLISAMIIHRIPRHTSSVEPCFQTGLLMAVAAYWLPAVLFLLVPMWLYLVYRNLFSFRSFLATLIGVAAVAVWVAVFYCLGILKTIPVWGGNGWGSLLAWIPTVSFLLAYIASSFARYSLRPR